MKRVIISGATGAIGSALIQQLIQENIEVLVLCRSESSRQNVIPVHENVQIKYCALSELKGLQNETGKTYDVFYHFAWAGTFGNSRNDTYLQSQNIEYSLDAVQAAKRFGCHTFIGAGSQAEYGRVEGSLKADTPTFPENGYGIAKLCGGQLTRLYAHQLGMKHVWVRILSVYGPHDGSQTMVMSTINKLLAGQEAQFTKGEQMWDYLYSGDAAEAFRLLGEKGVDGKTYVLGSGMAYPLKEYINIIAGKLDGKNLIKFGAIPYAQNQVMHLRADISELQNDTGWQAITDFETGVDRIVSSINGKNSGI